jgi:hypothetical protein
VAHSRWVTNIRLLNGHWGFGYFQWNIGELSGVIMWTTKMSHSYWAQHQLGDLEISSAILVWVTHPRHQIGLEDLKISGEIYYQ